MSNWNSVKDRLPARDMQVLVVVEVKNFSFIDLTWYKKKAFVFGNDMVAIWEITHWQPLPILPVKDSP